MYGLYFDYSVIVRKLGL